MNSRPDRSIDADRGATIIVVAMSLLLLMGFMAVAIDAGLGYNQRRGTQNAADNSALAAAWEDCNPVVAGAPDSVGAAESTARENGYDPDADNTEVTVTDIGGGKWQVDIEATDRAAFGSATPLAGDSLTVHSSAVAECHTVPFLGEYAIFAGAPSCPGGNDLNLSGASKIINGGIHSNDDLKITGSSEEINGDVTFMGDSNIDPDIEANKVFGNPYEYPVELAIGDFQPGGVRAMAAGSAYFNAGNAKIDNKWMEDNGHATKSGSVLSITESGIYYSGKEISLSGAEVAAGVEVTFVSTGKVSLNGQTELNAFAPVTGGISDPGILIFSTFGSGCGGPDAISFSVSSGQGRGVLFAPNGGISTSAANFILNGSIVGNTVNLSGSDFTISWVDNPAGIPDFRIDLLE